MAIKVKAWSAGCGHCKISLALGEEKICREFDWSFGQFRERLAGNILDMLGVGLAWVGLEQSPSQAKPIVIGRGTDIQAIETMNGNTVKSAWYDASDPFAPAVYVGNRMFLADVDQTVTNSTQPSDLVQEDDTVNTNNHPNEIGGVRYDF